MMEQKSRERTCASHSLAPSSLLAPVPTLHVIMVINGTMHPSPWKACGKLTKEPPQFVPTLRLPRLPCVGIIGGHSLVTRLHS